MSATHRPSTVVRRAATGFTVRFAEPARPRATLYALHGGGLVGDYWDCRVDPSLSLLRTATLLGFRVACPDRPGYRANAEAFPDGLPVAEEAALHGATIAELFDDAPVVLVGQSAGAIVSLHAAAKGEVPALVGLDYSGVGVRLDLDSASDGKLDKEEMWRRNWARRELFPPGTFDRGALPAAPTIGPDGVSAREVVNVFADLAGAVEVPVRVTFADNERWWGPLDSVRAEVAAGFRVSPSVATHVEPGAAHNISIGYAARSYHLAVVAFAERCLTEAGLQVG
jgi:pimeloyl-ACP methyl ester carboxylesterase